MTTTEKVAATYLRLNGFFLLPLFTVFDGKYHNHLDLVGVRMPGSKEEVRGLTLATDETLFQQLEKIGAKPHEMPTALAVEVKTNKTKGRITKEHLSYACRFTGTDAIYPVWFSDGGTESPFPHKQQLEISLPYAIDWVISRFDWMEKSEHKFALTKSGSWAWSEEFLSDLLVLRSLGVLKRLGK